MDGEQVGGGAGAGPAGSMPTGSGGGIDVADAVQVATNQVRVRLSGSVPIRNRGDVRDALFDRAWSIDAPNAPGIFIPRVVWADPGGEDQTVVLSLDADLVGPGRVYRVLASTQLIGEARPESARSASFRTFGEPAAARARATSKSFDLANVAPGTFTVDADGDYSTDAGLVSRKKRVQRRLTTPKGAFAHLPNYGLLLPIKRTFTVGDLRALQADALAQVHEEGILDAAVAIGSPGPGIVRLTITGTGLDDEGVTVEVSGAG